jgi:uncharacterized protein YggE
MVKPLALAALLLFTGKAFAQTQQEKIHVTAEAEIELPADQVVLQVQMNYRDYDNVKNAFDQHKAAEAKLLALIKDLKVPAKDVQYSLISFNRQMEYQADSKMREYFQTQQTVTVRLKDLKTYPAVVIKLVNAGFTNVSTGFTSSQLNDFPEVLLQKAVAQAKKKAEVIATAANRKLGFVTFVSDTAKSDPVFRAEVAYAKASDSGNLSSEIPQTVKRSLSLEVTFTLE